MHAVASAEDGTLDVCEVELRNLHRGFRSSYDSHVHTTASDGERTPMVLANEVYSGGQTVVVTDHYSISGYAAAAAELQSLGEHPSGKPPGGIIAGIEFSAKVDVSELRQIRKLHILGVGVDPRSKALASWLDDYRSTRVSDIGHAICVKDDLEAMGFGFHDRLAEKLARRRNVYQVLAESIFANPQNRRLIERHFKVRISNLASRRKRKAKNAQARKGIVKCIREWYGDFNASKPSLEEVLDLIRSAGGLSVVAHPVATVPQLPHFSRLKMTEVFMELKAYGVDGIEAYTPRHRIETADLIADAALESGLLITGGSDAHRSDHELGRLTNIPLQCAVPSKAYF
jgi:3',5'-nucleoside bisphosphate phosphatase